MRHVFDVLAPELARLKEALDKRNNRNAEKLNALRIPQQPSDSRDAEDTNMPFELNEDLVQAVLLQQSLLRDQKEHDRDQAIEEGEVTAQDLIDFINHLSQRCGVALKSVFITSTYGQVYDEHSIDRLEGDLRNTRMCPAKEIIKIESGFVCENLRYTPLFGALRTHKNSVFESNGIAKVGNRGEPSELRKAGRGRADRAAGAPLKAL